MRGFGVAEGGAVVLNITLAGASEGTYLTAYPAGQAQPNASNVNTDAGEVVPNMVIARVGPGGYVNLTNYKGEVHVVVDLLGTIAPGSGFEGLTPARALDTRSNTGKVGPGGEVSLSVLGAGGVPTSGVEAVVLNVTATEPSAPTFITAYPAGADRPTASNLNAGAGQTVAGLVVAKVGNDGSVNLYNFAGDTHLVVDVLGWFPPPPVGPVEAPLVLNETWVSPRLVANQKADLLFDGTAGAWLSVYGTGTGSAPAIGVLSHAASSAISLPVTSIPGRNAAVRVEKSGRAAITVSSGGGIRENSETIWVTTPPVAAIAADGVAVSSPALANGQDFLLTIDAAVDIYNVTVSVAGAHPQELTSIRVRRPGGQYTSINYVGAGGTTTFAPTGAGIHELLIDSPAKDAAAGKYTISIAPA